MPFMVITRIPSKKSKKNKSINEKYLVRYYNKRTQRSWSKLGIIRKIKPSVLLIN